MRAIYKSKIPVWYTEGFNPHPFITFALPISLGFQGINESMDMKLTNESYPSEQIADIMNQCLPNGLRITNVTIPQMKASEIKYASFQLKVSCDTLTNERLYELTNELLQMDEIIVEKKSKKQKDLINIKPYLAIQGNGPSVLLCEAEEHFLCLCLILPAGNNLNINPNLLSQAYYKYYNLEVFLDVTRLEALTADLKVWK